MRAQWLLMCVSTALMLSVATTGCSDAPGADDGSDSGAPGTTPGTGTKHDAGTGTTTPGVDSGKPGTGGPGTDASTGGDDDATTGDDDATTPGNGDDSSTGGQKDSGGGTTDPCSDPSLQWNNASKTNFTSYPAPGSAECIQYSGCQYEGQFQGCSQTESLSWVKAHNIVAIFPNFKKYGLHDLCLRSGSKTIVVTALDTCADSDCSGCCTENAKPSGNLIDVESFTDQRWGVDDGPIEFADLGPTTGGGCN